MGKSVVVADANGHKRAERKTGLAYVRQSELMRLSQVASEALREAERLTDEVHRQAFQAHVRPDGEATAEVDFDAARRSFTESVELIGMAEHYLRMLGDTVAAAQGDPWGRAF